MATSQSDEIYRIGSVEVRLLTREMVGSAGHAAFEPKVFELLIYLIEHRTRVVPKQELLETIWKTNFVSESVLSRAVMKLRRGFSDVGGDPESIKTLHRVGYRISGVVTKQSPPHAVSDPPASNVTNLAILPFENQTGDPALDWVELGLLTIMSRGMALARGVSICALPSVLNALGAAPEATDLNSRATVLAEQVGADRVVQVTVESDLEHGFRLAWRQWAADQPEANGVTSGPLLTTLANQLGAELAQRLHPETTAQEPKPLTPDEEFAAAAHGRALQAMAQEQYGSALALMDVCRAMGPHSIEVDIDYALALHTIDAGKAARLASDLMVQVDPSANPAAYCTLLWIMANWAMRQQDWAECKRYCDQAQPYLDPQRDYLNYSTFRFFHFSIAFHLGEVNSARAIARDWLASSRAKGDVSEITGALGSLAKLELVENWEEGKRVSMEAIQAARGNRSFLALSAAQINLAFSYLWHGEPNEALRLATESLGHAETADFGALKISIVAAQYVMAGEVGDSTLALEKLDELRPLLGESERESASPHAVLFADAQMRFGDVAQAATLASNQIARLMEAPAVHGSLGGFLTAVVAAAQFERARKTIAQTQSQYMDAPRSLDRNNYLHALAHYSYSTGDKAKSHQLLQQYVRDRGGAAGAFRGGPDMLWVAMDLGRLSDLETLEPLLSRHLQNGFCGQIVKARALFEQGHIASACELQRAIIQKASRRRMLPYLKACAVHYESALNDQVVRPVPQSPILPSAF